MKNFIRLYLEAYQGLSRPAWMLALVILINRSGAMVLPFLGVYMTGPLQFSVKEAGIVLSCFGLGAVAGSFLGGWLTDRAGHFRIQTGSLLMAVPVFLILPNLKTVETLAAGIFFLSTITETFRPANSVAVAYYARPENVTRAFSLNRMAINLGFSVGPALGGLLAAISYSWLFYGNGTAALLAGLVCYLYFRNRKGFSAADSRTRSAPAASPTSSAARVKSPYRDGIFLLFTLLSCLYGICFFQLLNTLPLFYREVHRLAETQIGLILAFNGAVVFLLEMFLVHLAERKMSTVRVIVLGSLLCGAAYLLLNAGGGLWMLFASMFVLSVSEILAMPFMATLTVQRSATQNRGAYMGLNALAFSAAHVLSPYLGTRVVADFGFTTLWWVTGLLSVITALAFYLVTKRM